MFDYPIMGDKLDLCNNRFTQTILHSPITGLHKLFYTPYMDDRIIIHPDKEYLKRLLKEIETIAGQLGITINKKKTQIVKISHGFTWLKTRYTLTDTGKIIRKIPRDAVKRERRRMKKIKQLVETGELTEKQAWAQYKSWRGDKKWYHAHRTLRDMDKLYKELMKNDK